MLLYSAATTPSLRGLVCNSSVLLGSHHQDTMLGCMLQVYSIECTMKRWEAHNHQGGLTACVFRTAYTLALFQLQVELTADEYNWSHPPKTKQYTVTNLQPAKEKSTHRTLTPKGEIHALPTRTWSQPPSHVHPTITKQCVV